MTDITPVHVYGDYRVHIFIVVLLYVRRDVKRGLNQCKARLTLTPYHVCNHHTRYCVFFKMCNFNTFYECILCYIVMVYSISSKNIILLNPYYLPVVGTCITTNHHVMYKSWLKSTCGIVYNGIFGNVS